MASWTINGLQFIKKVRCIFVVSSSLEFLCFVVPPPVFHLPRFCLHLNHSINHWICMRRHKFIVSYDNDTEASGSRGQPTTRLKRCPVSYSYMLSALKTNLCRISILCVRDALIRAVVYFQDQHHRTSPDFFCPHSQGLFSCVWSDVANLQSFSISLKSGTG